MAYQPIWEGEFDFAGDIDDGVFLRELLESVFSRKMMAVDWKSAGPGGGNPMIKLRGTKAQFASWIKEFYDEDDDTIGTMSEGVSYGDVQDLDRWKAYVEAYGLVCIA